MYESMLTHIDAVACSGKVIISANDSTVVEIVKETINSSMNWGSKSFPSALALSSVSAILATGNPRSWSEFRKRRLQS